MHVALVPTGGLRRRIDGEIVPSVAGERRIRKAAAILFENVNFQLLLIGREAEAYKKWIDDHYPRLRTRIHTDQNDVCTVCDVRKAAKKIGDMTTLNGEAFVGFIYVVCHQDQYRLIELALRCSGAKTVCHESGEPAPYPLVHKTAFFAVSAVDNDWSTSLAWPLRFAARLRAWWASRQGL